MASVPPGTEGDLINAARRDAAPAAPGETVTASAGSGVIGQSIGPYRLLSVLGEGGMGTVYLAEQSQPVRRRVALKIIKLGMDTRSVIARFEAERQALAMMDHPNLAKVFDAGTTEQGRPYFVMEHVAGVPITEHCDRNRLTLRERLALFEQVCQAVQHAHTKGVIHRDIKPTNVLVSIREGRAQVRVIDFGVAKATAEHLTEKTLVTEQGQLIGTPAYMSPEQAEKSSQDIDTRSDIYSLGVLLYELLTGATPFDARTLLIAGYSEMLRIIREVEPPKPSARVMAGTKASRHEGTKDKDERILVKALLGELDWIVMKCLEKDRARRYETANGLAMEIRRYLNDEPVMAGPPGADYRARKFIRRNRGAVIAASLVAFALVVGILGTSIELVRAVNAERQAVAARSAETTQRRLAELNEKKAQTAAHKSEQVASFLSEMLRSVGPSVALGRDTTLLREILDKTDQRVATELKDQPEVEGEIRITIGRVYRQLGDDDKAEATQTEALRLLRSALGNEHVELAAAMYEIAECRRLRGNFDSAETMFNESLSMRTRLLGENHPDVAWSLDGMAKIKYFHRQLSEADELFRKALAIRRRVYGPEHLEVAESLNNLSVVLRDLRPPEESEQMLREAIAMRRRLAGDLYPDYANDVKTLAATLRLCGDLAGAEEMRREVVRIEKKVLGAGHPETLSSAIALATALRDQGKLDEAEATCRQAMIDARNSLSPNDQITLIAARTLADILRRRGQFDEALKLIRGVLDIDIPRPNQNPNVDKTLYVGTSTSYAFSILIQTLADAGMGDESAVELKRDLELLHRALSPDDPRLAMALAQTASVLLPSGFYKDAEPLLRECLGICEKKAFPDGKSHVWSACTAKSMLGEAIAEGTMTHRVRGTKEKFAASQPSKSEPDAFSAIDTIALPVMNDRISRLDEAERLLLEGYRGIKEMPLVFYPPQTCTEDCKRQALERVIRLYEIREGAEPGKGYDAKAAEWRAKLDNYLATTKTATTHPTAISPSQSPSSRFATNPH